MDNFISTLSSMLGYTMVAASFVMVLPQIYNIVMERRVDGMSLTSLLFDLIAAIMGFTMNWTLSNPFSVYGELVPVLCQHIILIYLILFYKHSEKSANMFLIYFSVIFVTLLLTQPFTLLWYLNLPVAIAALLGKLQQIQQIYEVGDAGVLSLSSSILGSIGVTIRNFTIIILYLQTPYDNRDNIGLAITIILGLCRFVITYQVYYFNFVANVKSKLQ